MILTIDVGNSNIVLGFLNIIMLCKHNVPEAYFIFEAIAVQISAKTFAVHKNGLFYGRSVCKNQLPSMKRAVFVDGM